MSIDLKISGNHLHYNGLNYFRGNADDVALGDVGEKCTPSTQTNYLSVRGNVVRKSIKINKASQISLKGMALASADIGASINVPGRGSLSAGSVASLLKEDTLRLVKLSVLPKDIIEQVNDNPSKALNPLKDCGRSGRIVHQVFVILESKTAVTFDSASRFDVTVTGGGFTVNASGGVGGSAGATAEVSAGSTFAYLLLDPEWDANMQKNWTKVVDGKDDQWSLY